MRLRLTIRRHGLPTTSILWPTEEKSTIAELLEAVNESVPIEAEQWGFEDYAVELKGYECLHYQRCGQVFKEDDEVVVRPLLTQDIKTRKQSGRHQISADGYLLYDGLAYGKTLTRALTNRPEVKIPPRKKRRITYHEDDDSDQEELETAGVKLLDERNSSNSDKQLVLHTEFDDDDDEEDDDDDFEPGLELEEDDLESDASEEEQDDASDSEDTSSSSEEDEEEAEEEEGVVEGDITAEAEDQETLDGIPDEATRAKVRKLHSAFPSSRLAVCNLVLVGTDGDLGEAYEALLRGFHAVKPKSAITEVLEGSGNTSDPKKHSKSKKRTTPKLSQSPDDYDPEAVMSGKIQLEASESSKAKSIGKELAKSKSELFAPKTRSQRRHLIDQKSVAIDSDDEDSGNLLDKPHDLVDDFSEGSEDSEEDVDSRTKYYDQNGFPPGSIQGGKLITFGYEVDHPTPGRPASSRRSNSTGSHKGVQIVSDKGPEGGLTSTPFIDQDLSDDESSDNSSDTSSEESSDEEGEEISGDEENTSDSDSSDSDTSAIEREVKASSSSSDSDSSSESSSDDEAPEEVSSKATLPHIAESQSVSISDVVSPQSLAPTSAPGRGKSRTKCRNARRRQSLMLQRLKEKGILPSTTTVRELRDLPAVNLSSSPEEGFAALAQLRNAQFSAKDGHDSLDDPSSQSQDFETRRRELLAALAAGGVEVGGNTTESTSEIVSQGKSQVDIVDVDIDVPAFSQSQARIEDSQPVPEPLPEAKSADTTTSAPSSLSQQSASMAEQASETQPQNQTSPLGSYPARRPKFDLGAGRRMLFNSLGIKPPKSKEDEDKVRKELMKDIKPLRTPITVEELSRREDEETLDEDLDAWRQRINYRAVECVQEGIVLSEPPFPFVQRWDPQQQRGGKRKNNQRDQFYGYEEPRASKKQKKKRGKHSYAEQQAYLDESYQPSFANSLNYDDYSQVFGNEEGIAEQVSQQLLDEITMGDNSQDPDDLAPLPENPSALPILEAENIRSGMTIAFKTLEMNAATRWQPQLSDYQTAIVLNIQDGEIHLTLAKRDRAQHQYDEETGERIYEKFEMPVDEEDEDDGMLIKTFEELKEPRVVQEAPTDDNDHTEDPAETGKIVSTSESYPLTHNDAQEQTHFEHLSDLQDAQQSLVTETPIQSDAPNWEDQNDGHESPRFCGSEGDTTPTPSQALFLHNKPDSTKNATKSQELSETSSPLSPSRSPANIHRPATPNLLVEPTDAESLGDPISARTRQEIGHLIKDAGFRSSIPSSLMRSTPSNFLNTPGDDAVFEKLLRDMEPKNVMPSSPRSTGYDVTPTKERDLTPTPQLSLSGPAPSLPNLPMSDNRLSLSPVSISANSVEAGDPDSQAWETENEELESTPSNAKTERKHNSVVSRPRKRVPIGAAQAVWEQLAGLRAKSPSLPEADDLTPELGTIQSTIGNGAGADILYPKLSTESSFASAIADHGRQPDFELDDNAVLNPEICGEDSNDAEIEEYRSEDVVQVQLSNPPNEEYLAPRESPESQNGHHDDGNRSVESSDETPAQLLSYKSPISRRIASLLMSPRKTRTPKTPATAKITVHHKASPRQNHAQEASPSEPPLTGGIVSKVQNQHQEVLRQDQPAKALDTPKTPREISPLPQATDSDDDLPSIEKILSQRPVELQNRSPITNKNKRGSDHLDREDRSGILEDRAFQKTSGSESVKKPFSDIRYSAKRSNTSRDSLSAVTQSRHSESSTYRPNGSQRSPVLQPPTSQFSASQSESMFIDLTQSSDAEDEPVARPVISTPSASQLAAALMNSDDEKPKQFNSYNMDSDEDWDSEVGAWVKKEKKVRKFKKSESTASIGTKKANAKKNGLKNSSQTSLNTKGRKSSSQY